MYNTEQAPLNLHARKHRKVSVARAPLAISGKQVSVETTEVPCEPNIASREAKQAPREPKQALCETITVSTETKLASRQRVNVAHETIKVSANLKQPLQRLCELQSS